MDHNRSEGEALGPQEYTAIKMEVVSWPNPEIEKQVNEKVGGGQESLFSCCHFATRDHVSHLVDRVVDQASSLTFAQGWLNELLCRSFPEVRNLPFQKSG